MRTFLLTLYIALMLTSCKNARIQRQLRLANKHLNRAIELGAEVDSLKKVVHDTITVTSIRDSIQTVAKIDTVTLKELCPEVTTVVKKKAIQKAVCPNDSIDKVINIPFTMGVHKYQIPVHLKAWSISGKAGYDFKVLKDKFEYTKTEIKTEIKPAERKSNWYWFLITGIFIGVIGMILIRRI